MYNQKLCITHHSFLISVQKKCGFSNNFVGWIEIIMSKQESCIINGGNTTQYFHLERGSHQGGPTRPISLSLLQMYYIFWLEIIKTSKVSIFLIIFFYIQLTQVIQLFSMKTRNQQWNLQKHLLCFSFFSGLKPNIS